MNDVFIIGLENFLSPPVLCFLLGLVAGFSKSDLYVPDQLGKGLSMFLMFAIGLQGGVATSSSWSLSTVLGMALSILLSFSIPFLCQIILRRTTRHSLEQISLVSAHYGSISIVTFATAMEFLKRYKISYEPSVIPMAALMETPAILAGFLLIYKTLKKNTFHNKSILLKEVFLNGAIMLLLGGFVIGMVANEKSLETTMPFFVLPLKGVLCFFLLDLGLKVSTSFVGFRNLGFPLIAFGVYMPFLGALIGSILGALIGLELGTCICLGVLTASASYIAVPAAMNTAFPHLNNSIAISLSLGITFPFNIFLGIPLYTHMIVAFYDKVRALGV